MTILIVLVNIVNNRSACHNLTYKTLRVSKCQKTFRKFWILLFIYCNLDKFCFSSDSEQGIVSYFVKEFGIETLRHLV